MRRTATYLMIISALLLVGMTGCQSTSQGTPGTSQAPSASAGHDNAAHAPHTGAAPAAVLLSNLGNFHHPVSTKNAEAQRYFDQGLTLAYAFNHDEAIRSFQHAAELDPQLAMAWWGVAMALGPNYNADIDPAREKAAFEAVQKALRLSASAPEPAQAYIRALAKRYNDDPKADLKKLSADYTDPMPAL